MIAGGIVNGIGSLYGGLQQGAAYDEQAALPTGRQRLG